jgi:hypothetical protein
MLKAHRRVNLKIDEQKAQVLRNKLLEYRFRTLQCENEPFECFEPFPEGYKELEFADGRLIELYTSLLAVSNEGRENILEHAKNTFEMRQMEQHASIEATIIEILVKNNIIDEKNIVMTKDIADIINKDSSDRDKWKTSSLGWKVRGLGFQKVHCGSGNGWLINKKRLAYLAQDYGIKETSPKNIQKVQKVHNIDEVFEKPSAEELKPYVCCLCQKSMPLDGYMTTIYEGKTCHVECYRKLKGI